MKVMVTVKSSIIADGQRDEVEVVQVGTLGEVHGELWLKYEEILEDNGRRTTNLIKINTEETSVDITKRGEISSHMEFRQGERTSTFYNTPFGGIDMGLHTRMIALEETSLRLVLELEYAIEVNHEMISENHVTIVADKGYDRA
jgi:uncharacterized beta-barrel protein YwiB (DUF1934 family)